MSNPVVRAFFVGRALAETINEKIEDTLTNALSELGKFDAEQRERLHQFIDEVLARADREAAKDGQENSSIFTSEGFKSAGELQETIDELRAEIAQVRAELKQYRSTST